MLKLKELENRIYEGKNCVGFDYRVFDTSRAKDDPNGFCFEVRWRKAVEPGRWVMSIVLPRNRDCDSQVFNFDYQMPREGLDLTLIAATGLKYFQLYLKQEIQVKSNYDFVLGDLLKDM